MRASRSAWEVVAGTLLYAANRVPEICDDIAQIDRATVKRLGLAWSLDLPETLNQTFEIGGAEYFPFRQAVEIIQSAIGKTRWMLPIGLPYLRTLTVMLETAMPGFPFSTFWVDYFSYNRTCAVDAVPRLFGFLPARFTYRLDHLKGINWNRQAWQTFFRRGGRSQG